MPPRNRPVRAAPPATARTWRTVPASAGPGLRRQAGSPLQGLHSSYALLPGASRTRPPCPCSTRAKVPRRSAAEYNPVLPAPAIPTGPPESARKLGRAVAPSGEAASALTLVSFPAYYTTLPGARDLHTAPALIPHTARTSGP